MVRDVEKLLTTKQYYTGNNAYMHLEPSIHATAILEGFRSEKVSLLVETLLEHRASSFPTHRRNYDLEY